MWLPPNFWWLETRLVQALRVSSVRFELATKEPLLFHCLPSFLIEVSESTILIVSISWVKLLFSSSYFLSWCIFSIFDNNTLYGCADKFSINCLLREASINILRPFLRSKNSLAYLFSWYNSLVISFIKIIETNILMLIKKGSFASTKLLPHPR